MTVVGETDLEVRWQADRQLAQIYVLEAGADLAVRLRQKLRWLVGGHIAHISVYMPTDAPVLAEMGPALQELGLFVSGMIPGFFRGERDALVLQAIAFSKLDPTMVNVEGAAAGVVRDHVVDGWEQSRGRLVKLLKERGRGRVAVRVEGGPNRAAG